jgi:hypothetical protein
VIRYQTCGELMAASVLNAGAARASPGKLYHPSSSSENIGMPFMDWPESWSPDRPYFFPRDDPLALTCAEQGPFPNVSGSQRGC